MDPDNHEGKQQITLYIFSELSLTADLIFLSGYDMDEEILGQFSDDEVSIFDVNEDEDDELISRGSNVVNNAAGPSHGTVNDMDSNSDLLLADSEDDGAQRQVYNFKWRKETAGNHFIPQLPEFQSPARKFNLPLTDKCTPFEVLRQFLDTEIISSMIMESNRYADSIKEKKHSAMPGFKPITEHELWSFLGLEILMGVVKKPAINDYWSTNGLLLTPIFIKTMSRNRYDTNK
jgi:hypothetical protein